jgi:hypothetical protein
MQGLNNLLRAIGIKADVFSLREVSGETLGV